MKAKTQKTPYLKSGTYTVDKVNELNFFDLSGEKAKTKGTSNKMYHAELHLAKSGDKAQIFSMYGPTGRVLTEEYRPYDDQKLAQKEYERLLKSKRKKGYKDIDVAQRSLGTDDAKDITKAVVLNNSKELKKELPRSKLDSQTQQLMKFLFGATQDFVATTLKCPLGQLTNQQVDDGRVCLDSAKKIVNANKKLTKKHKDELLELTNEFYGLIPHNLGSGARGQMSHLLLDSLDKIMGKEDDLDTLLDAKSVGAVLSTKSSVDEKYKTLSADIKAVEHDSDVFKFLSQYFIKTKVSGHGYATHKVKNIWAVSRHGEGDHFLTTTSKIAKQYGKNTFARETSKLSKKQSENWVPRKRPDLDSELCDVYNKANTWLCWHGTRSANLVGITKRGLLIRPSGAIHTGAMFGPGMYLAWQSTKSLNYCDGGHWTRNTGSKSNSKFMFLLDSTMGHMYKAPRSFYYKKPPKSYHSVYGKANYSGVINDEMIIYDTKQAMIRYLLEIV